MKANRRFRQHDLAVTPIIGVILMIAITVVISTAALLVVSNIGGTGDSAPAVAFYQDETHERLEVASAGKGANWDRLAVHVVSCQQSEIGVGGVTTGAKIVMGNSGAHVETPALATSTSSLNQVDSGPGSTSCGAAILVEVTDAYRAMVAAEWIQLCNASTGPAGADASFVEVHVVDTSANALVWAGKFNAIRDC